MKKQFLSKPVPRGTRTIWRYLSALILLFSLSIGQMWGAVYATYSVSDLTYTSATLTYEKSGLSGNDQKLNKGERKVEVPCASASGTLYLSGTGANADRYASIWGSNGTAVDATRKIAMTSGYGSGISFTSDDILTDGEKYYIIFSNVDGSDYKINAFKYVLSSACSSGGDPVDPTITFNNGAYTVGGSELDLSSLFSSNSSGAVTYTVKTDGGTSASISGTNFSASAAGTCVVTASQAAVTGSYNAKAVDANIVVSASSGGGEDPEPTCPTEGQLYSAVTTATGNISIATTDGLELNSSTHKTTVSGGKMYVISKQSSAKNLITNGAFCHTNNDTYFKVELDCALAAGDVISVNVGKDGSNDRGVWVSTATSRPSSAPACALTAKSSSLTPKTYAVTSTDEYFGKKVLYVYRATANSTYFNNVVITRPYSVLYDNLKEAIHTMPAKAVEFTLQELTNATFNHTGWTADKLVKVGGVDKAAGTALGKTDVVTLTDNTTFTATWEAKVTKYTVTYYDGEAIEANKLGSELVNEGSNPTATGIVAPHKLGYSFAGWSTTNGGAVAALNTIVVADDMPLYAVYSEINCAALSGTIFSLAMDVAPAANCTIKTASGYDGSVDLVKYATISGGIAMAENSSTNNHLIITTDPLIRFTGGSGYVHISFDCALKVGDKIKTTISNQNIAYTTTSTRSTTNYFTKGTDQELTITSGHALENATEIYLWAASSSDGRLSSLQVIRPEKYEVSFNMHNHGDAVAKQYILEGGKVTEPATASITGWDFGGWFKESTFENEWDFATDVVNAATELHAKWTEHVASSDATLKDLTVNGVTVAGFDPATEEYNVVLEMGTTTTPEVAGVPNDANYSNLVYVQTSDPTDDVTVTVTAENGSTSKTYTIHFSIATSKDINLVWATGTTPCKGTPDMSTQIKSNNAAVSTYINQITFTNVEGAGDDGAEGTSLNVGKKAGNMFTLTAKPGYAFAQMHFFAKIEDATCEYSIDGSDWTELASANTGGNECYAPFSGTVVHEFRLRSTGNSGVWIRNMQLNIVEACTPIVVAWDEEPVEFEVGKAGYAIAATANNSGTITYGSTDASIVAVDAGNGVLSVGDLGSVTLSASTAEGDGTTYCANSGNPIVISKVVNTYYLVKFDGQNGEEADEVKFYASSTEIALPTAPSYPGFDFQGWFDAETGGNQYVENITPTASITVYAQWVAQCPGATITTQPVGASYLTGRTPAALVCEASAGNNGTLTYEWFTCDDDQKTNPVAATATPSTAVAGTFYYFCKVMEEGCDVEAYSDVVTITVADKDPIYLAWVDVTGQNAVALDASKSLYAPEVSAAGIKNSSTYGGMTGYKFNSAPGYIAIEGAPFKEGDIVEMFVTTVTADKARVFNANEAVAANVVAEGAANMVQGANKVALTADANNLYLRRGNDFDGWNPYVAYVAVYRACAPILNKVTVAGVEAAPDNTNHVAIEVPASTADAALDAIAYDWVSNDAAWTAAHAPVVANAWEFGVENTVTFADKDGDESVYYVTISKAAASSDATLSALTVNGQAIALEDGVFEYSFELPYGTSVAPTVVATANHVAAVATVDPCTVSGATITVVPESGEDDKQVYTLTFTISAWKEVVIWDGSTMSAVATSPDATTGFAWAVNGFGSISNYNTTCGEKSYTKVLPSGGSVSASRNITLTVPAGYVAKFYVVMASHSDGNERGMFIGSNLVKDPDATSVLELSNNDRDIAVAGMSEVVGAGTWYINPNASIDFQEIRAYLRKGMVRNQMLGNGVLGTSCVDHNVAIEDIQGATFYELVGRDYNNYGKLAFDKIISGELEAGVPYVFQAHGDKMILFYGEDVEPAPVDKGNGMYGTFEQIVLTELDDVYYFAQRALWSCDGAIDLTIPANRAYVKLSEIGEVPSSNPAPGRQRILMAVNGEKVPEVATGMDELNDTDAPVKVLINGQIFILRGEKMYDATGRLVK